MGCGKSKAADPAAKSAENSGSATATPEKTEVKADEAGFTAVTPGEKAALAAPGAVEVQQAKEITKEKFEAAIKKLLDVAIDGYPKALRSTLSRRNELLRRTAGNQDAAAELIKAEASKMTQEGKTWLLGLIPYVGLPASVLYPSWLMLRRVCLLAATFGLDLSAEVTRAKILNAFAGLRAVPAAEFAVETAVQAVWTSFAGPVAGMIPIGTLTSKVVNIEGAVVDAVGRESFETDRRVVPAEEYGMELDPEPTAGDYLQLAKEGTASALMGVWQATLHAKDTALDSERRTAAGQQALQVGSATAATGAALAIGGTLLAMDAGKQAIGKVSEVATPAVQQGIAQAQQAVQKGQETMANATQGAKKAP